MRKLLVRLLLALLCSGLMGASVLAGEGNVAVSLWFPSFSGFDSVIGYRYSLEPLSLVYSEDNGIEVRGEFILNQIPVGMAYWSVKTEAVANFDSEANGEISAKLFDLYLGKELGFKNGFTLVGGLRNFELTRNEKVRSFGDYQEYVIGYEDSSESSMWGPMVGIKANYDLGKAAISAGIKVGALINEIKTTWEESTNPAFSADVDLALVIPLNEKVDFEAGYRSVVFTNALSRQEVYTYMPSSLISYGGLSENVELSDISMSGGRIGVILYF